jgi:hypothetical protein
MSSSDVAIRAATCGGTAEAIDAGLTDESHPFGTVEGDRS